MKIRIGHSPDPDDAFLFYAMTHGKVDCSGFEICHQLEGIEQLNQRALQGELEMTAISLHAYPYCAQHYVVLPTGASVGDGYGPIVVALKPLSIEELKKTTIAIPGRLTTAALMLQLALGRPSLTIMPFDQILPAVVNGDVPAGILIHEGQLTYGGAGLKKILDLGEWWKQKTTLPAPLGINVVRRDLGLGTLQKLAHVFKESLEYAFAHRQEALAYAKQYGRGLNDPLTDQFVGMYVNQWSVECRPEAAAGMQRLLDWAAEEKLTPRRIPIEFVED